MKTVIVTGAAGFLGSHISEHYLNLGRPVIGIDNLSTGMKENVDYLKSRYPLFHFVESDVVQNWNWVQNLPSSHSANISHIFHFASPASPPLYQALALETMWVNTVGLKNCLEFADQVHARVIFASTSEIYGDPSISPQPETYWGNVNTVGPRSCYDEAKRFGESLLYTHNWKRGTKHGMIRIFNTYGPRMNPSDGRVIINFLEQARLGHELTVYGDGKQTRSFCYVSDLISGLTQYAEGNWTEPMNIGNDNEFTILELAQAVQEMFPEKNLRIVFEPLPKDDPKQRKPDITKAKANLSNWSPKIQLKEGLVKMYSSLK